MQMQEVPSLFGSQKPDHNLEKTDCQGSASKFIFGVDLRPPLLYVECLECYFYWQHFDEMCIVQ